MHFTTQVSLVRQVWVLSEDDIGPGHITMGLVLGARLRGRTATQRSKKGTEKVLRRVLGKAS